MYLLGEVIDELSIDEDVDPVVDDLLAFPPHLVFLRLFNLCHLVKHAKF